MKILLVDQFQGPSPYEVQQNPRTFEALCEQVLAAAPPGWRKPQVLEVSGSYIPPYCTTAWRADENGMAECWRYNWDSSG